MTIPNTRRIRDLATYDGPLLGAFVPVDPQSGDTKKLPLTILAEFLGGVDGLVPATRIVGTGGLATGGGPLMDDLTITVPAASNAEALAGTSISTAMTPANTAVAIDAAIQDLAEEVDSFLDTKLTRASNLGDLVSATAARSNLGLGNVDNTADAAKPVSTATAAALAGKSATGHAHAIGDVTGLSAALLAAAPPSLIGFFPLTAAPTGWLKANGAAISRTAYAALFALIGTTCGAGDGSTTFNLPDLRGEFVRGLDDGRGVDASRAIGTAQAQNSQDHIHLTGVGYDVNSIYGKLNGSGLPDPGSTGGTGIYTFYASGGVASAGRFANTYGATGFSGENRPRNVALLACIKF